MNFFSLNILERKNINKQNVCLVKSSNEYIYPVEKIILHSNTTGTKKIFYKVIKLNIKYRIDKYDQIKKIKFNLVKNNFSLFSNNSNKFFNPSGEIIIDNNLNKINSINILETKNFNGNLFLNKKFRKNE